MRIICILALTITCAISVPAMAKTEVDLDIIETIKLNAKTPTSVQINVPKTGLLRADIFSTSGITGTVHIAFQIDKIESSDNEFINPAKTSKVVNKGRYTADIWAEGNQVGEVQVRFTLDPALDIYEPNDSLSQAKSITTPYLGLVRVSAGDEDWFRVDVPSGNIIGAHLRTQSQYAGPEISFHKVSGELLYGSSKDEWGHRGMRYYRSEGKPVLIKIIDNYDWNPHDVRAFRQLAIEAYPPASNGTNLFVKIDMNAAVNSSTQIDFISAASGSRTASAAEADEISTALQEAFRPNKISLRLSIIISAIGLIALLGLGWLYWRKQKVQTETLPDENA